jgi:hypothetical protein
VRVPGGLLLLLLAPLVPVAQGGLERHTPPDERRAPRIVPANQVRRMAPGFDVVMADLYWLRTVQYFGHQRLFAETKSMELLYPLIDVTTDLDPRLEIAYRYGSIFLAEARGAGRPDLAIKLLKKGAAANPNSWRLRQDLGFYHFLFLNEPLEAARILTEAAKIPGAPYWLETLGAHVLGKGGQRASARMMWARLYEQAEGQAMKENARIHLLNLEALDQVDAIHAAVDAYRQRHGVPPPSLAALSASGFKGPIVDPAGTPFRYDPKEGRASVDLRSKAFSP